MRYRELKKSGNAKVIGENPVISRNAKEIEEIYKKNE